jgi:Uma2 family endonuclease
LRQSFVSLCPTSTCRWRSSRGCSVKRAFYTGAVTINWATDENYQWDLPDASGRFYIPDIAFIHPDATTAEEERAAIALVVEVTSPTSPDTVLNDRITKPVQYAKAGVPLYLLVDQELGRWTLFGLAEGWERYQVAADGAYGEEISLPAPLNWISPSDIAKATAQ